MKKALTERQKAWLAGLRAAVKGTNMSELAERIGWQPGGVLQFADGRRDVSAAGLIDLALALGMELGPPAVRGGKSRRKAPPAADEPQGEWRLRRLLGRLLPPAAKAAGLSYAALAARCGCAPTTVSMVARGQLVPGAALLLRLAAELELDANLLAAAAAGLPAGAKPAKGRGARGEGRGRKVSVVSCDGIGSGGAASDGGGVNWPNDEPAGRE